MQLKNKSLAEIRFRLGQEVCNLKNYLLPPKSIPAAMRPMLPAAADVVQALRGSAFEDQITAIANQILEHRIPIFGGILEPGPAIRWRKDYASAIETGAGYFRFIPYLDPDRAGDHKNIWEPNRHQHLVALAQAGLFSRKEEYWKEISSQLDSWFIQNPYGCGINWTSALEVAFRSLSWIWLLHLGHGALNAETKKKLSQGLFQHAVHLENNLSVYFAPNTHLLGEAVALHAIGILFPDWAESKRWVELGGRVVLEEMDKQVHPDGAHIEQSTYYHVYALDMFLFHMVMRESNPYDAKLAKMAAYLESILGPARSLTCFGDDDGGRFFHPFGRGDQFGMASLATSAHLLKMNFPHRYEDILEQAAWWLGPKTLIKPKAFGPRGSRLFRDAGIASLVAGNTHVLMDAGPFGPWTGGHSHADALSITLRHGSEELLVDSGTFTYVGDAAERNYFRGTGAHNTIRIDHLDQATLGGPFSWGDRPEVKILNFESTSLEDFVEGECLYRGFRHRRRLLFRKPEGLILVCDLVHDQNDGASRGEHDVEQIWQTGETLKLLQPGVFQIGKMATLILPGSTHLTNGWRSRTFGTKEKIPMVHQIRRSTLPVVLPAAISLSGEINIGFHAVGEMVEFTTVKGNRFRLGK